MKEIKRKDKVLFIMQIPPPVHGASMMGEYIRNSELINSSFECHYINPSMARDVGDLAKISLRKLLLFPRLLYNIRKVIKRTKPDLCYFTPASGKKGFYKSFLIVWWLKLHSQKVVAHFHNKGISRRKDELLDKKLFKIFFKNIKLIILSEYLYPEFQEYVPFEEVFICPNGIPETIKELSEIKTSESEVFSLLFLSNMLVDKGVILLLEACSILKNRGCVFKCNFVGKWSEVSENLFKSKVKELDIQGFVEGYGAKYNDEKISFFQNTDAFVFPTFYENETFGLVLLEAMEYAIPCISTYEGGIPSVVSNGESGILIKERSPEVLADSIQHLMDNPELRLQMGIEGRKRFKEFFTIDVFEHRIKKILNEIIENK